MSVGRERLRGDLLARLATYLGARPVRCDYCRYSFAAWRPLYPAGARAEHVRLEQRTIRTDD